MFTGNYTEKDFRKLIAAVISRNLKKGDLVLSEAEKLLHIKDSVSISVGDKKRNWYNVTDGEATIMIDQCHYDYG